MRQLRSFADDRALPEEVRSAAVRLQARLARDFKSASEDPIVDALTIINHIRDQLA
jgi:hypothetical protein